MFMLPVFYRFRSSSTQALLSAVVCPNWINLLHWAELFENMIGTVYVVYMSKKKTKTKCSYEQVYNWWYSFVQFINKSCIYEWFISYKICGNFVDLWWQGTCEFVEHFMFIRSTMRPSLLICGRWLMDRMTNPRMPIFGSRLKKNIHQSKEANKMHERYSLQPASDTPTISHFLFDHQT